MYTQKEIQQMHCGLISATIREAEILMPEIVPLLNSCPTKDNYRFDVKVHMLMPNQWPCIPNWHCDFVPRDEDNKLRPERILPNARPLYLWLSNEPLTEFEDGRKITPESWIEFTQHDKHRGVKSKDFIWRLFVRAVPEEAIPEKVFGISGLRRHSQVYLEPDFTW